MLARTVYASMPLPFEPGLFYFGGSPGFAAALEQAADARIAELGYSRYLAELERKKLI